MDLEGKSVVVTGGAGAIGAALAAHFEAAGARVCVFDLPGAVTKHGKILCDVGDPRSLEQAITEAEQRHGPVDIFVSNAGVLSDQPGGAASATDVDWARCWSVNVMAHVYAARILLPTMIARGSGHFVIVASAAGLLNQIGDAAYSATKHAAVSFAESLAITHYSDGITVSLVCPQYVATPLIGLADQDAASHADLLTADEVAQIVLDGVREAKFLILPHPQVAGYAQLRARDHDAWISKMTRLRDRSVERFGDARPERFYKLV